MNGVKSIGKRSGSRIGDAWDQYQSGCDGGKLRCSESCSTVPRDRSAYGGELSNKESLDKTRS